MSLLAFKCMNCCFFFPLTSRIGENLEQSLPNLKELVLTSNNIQELVSTFQNHRNRTIYTIKIFLVVLNVKIKVKSEASNALYIFFDLVEIIVLY